MLASDLSADRLELPEILAQASACAGFDPGRDHVRALRPTTDPGEARARLTATAQARWLLGELPGFSVGGAQDVRAAADAAARGSRLSPTDLQAVAAQLRAVRLTRRTLDTHRASTPALWRIAEPLADNPELESRIEATFDEQGRVADTASAELHSLRRQLRQAVAAVHAIMQKQLRSPAAHNALQEALITERAGRQVVPVKLEHQGSFPGIVHDTSASGATVYMEPLAAVPANNRVRGLESAERHEIDRILRALSAEVGVARDDIVAGVDGLGVLDGLLALAHYADTHEAVEPSIAPDAGFELTGARHPLLEGDVVPIDVEIPAGGSQAIVITGPNTGGKTVALKTVGLLHLMAACGLHVPAASARLAVYHPVLADIGDEQSIEQSLSTFASHMRNLVAMVQAAGPRALVLADELGAGTDPTEGAALGQAILERLLDAGAVAVVTTHHPELKLFAHRHPRARNASVEFDTATLRPTYRLLMDVPGRSNAFDIATGLGLDPEIVEAARAKLTTEFRDVEGLIGALQRDRRELAGARARVADEAQRLVAAQHALDERLTGVDDEREHIVGDARREARALLRQSRAALRQAEQAARQAPGASTDAARRRMRGLETQLDAAGPPDDVPRMAPVLEIREGDRVRVEGFSREAVVVAVDAAEAVIGAGNVHTRVPRAHVQEVLAPQPRPRRRAFRGGATPPAEVHVRGERVVEALEQVDLALDAALLHGASALRVVHGVGTGTLRRAIRGHVSEHPSVVDMADAPPTSGGAGVTVVVLASGGA